MNTSQQFLTKYDQIYVILLDLDSSPHRLTSITNVVDYSTIKKIVDGFFDWFFGRLYCVRLYYTINLSPFLLMSFLASDDKYLLIHNTVKLSVESSLQLFPMIIVCKTALWIMDYLMHPYLREKLVKGRPFIRSLKMQSALDPLSG